MMNAVRLLLLVGSHPRINYWASMRPTLHWSRMSINCAVLADSVWSGIDHLAHYLCVPVTGTQRLSVWHFYSSARKLAVF